MDIKPQTYVKLKNGQKALVVGKSARIDDEKWWIGHSTEGPLIIWDEKGNCTETTSLKVSYCTELSISGPWVDIPNPVEFETKVCEIGLPYAANAAKFHDSAILKSSLIPFIGKRVRVRVEAVEE